MLFLQIVMHRKRTMLEYLHLRKFATKTENEKKNNLSSEMKVSIHSLMMGSSGPDDRGVSTFSLIPKLEEEEKLPKL